MGSSMLLSGSIGSPCFLCAKIVVMPVLFPWLEHGRGIAQREQGKLRLLVSQKKPELPGRHRWSVRRELLLHLEQRQPHALQQHSAKYEGVTGVILPLLPLLSQRTLLLPHMASCRRPLNLPTLEKTIAMVAPRHSINIGSVLATLYPSRSHSIKR